MGTLLRGWLCAVIGCLALVGCSIDKVRYTPADDDDDGSGGRTTAMVTVQLTGTGHGTIAAQGVDFVCGATCTATVPLNKAFTLVATPDTGAVFGGWVGADCTGETCAVTASNDVTLGAKFDVQTFTVDVELIGSGEGIVMSSAGGLVCPGNCAVQVAYGTAVSFTAAPTASSVFLAWSGECSGTAACEVTVTQDRHVGATFAKQNELVVVKAGNGGGVVKSDPAGIDCGTDCTEAYQMGTSVALTATPDADSTFTGWAGGGCAGTGACTVAMNAATQVTATFVLQKRTLTVSKAGNGKGTVTATGIECGADCSEDYDIHTPVTLVAVADGDSIFTGWSGGGCSGTAMCTVTLDASTTVTATFTLKKYTLAVSKAGNGTGVVTSSPAGINCGTDCSEDYNAHAVITLTAVATAADSTFTGWSGGGCTGTGGCTVTLDASTAVTATFVLQKRTLTVSKTGNGTGVVTSSPAGINCGATCSASYDAHTVVTLTATPTAADSTFTGWSGGGCSGTGTCAVTLDASTAVTATFALQKRTLTVAKAGNGTGAVTSSPAGINCGATCSASYDAHTVVTLTATPTAADSVFAGWSGSCTGMGTCAVTLDNNAAVTAMFVLQKRTLTIAKSGNGTVTSTPAGINCGADCSEDYDAHSIVTLTATPATDSTFTGWSGGGCSGAGTCAVTLDNSATVTATFALKQFTLTVVVSGGGTGTVGASGIACPGDCTESYPINTVVPLTLSTTGGSTFAGWSGGGCSGTGACQVTMTADVTVTAKFDPPKGVVVVGNYTNPGSVSSFPIAGNGDVAPLRTITGSKTTLSNVRGLAVSGSELFVADQGSNAVAVFPVTADGDVAPSRRIFGDATTLSAVSAVVIYNGEIYVSQKGSIPVAVFPISANGNVAPTRTIGLTVGSNIQYAAIANGELFLASTTNSILVVPANASGTVAPTRTITPPTGVSGIAVSGGEIFATTLNLAASSIYVFPQDANGAVAPSRTITGTETLLQGPDQIVVFNGEIFTANYLGASAVVHPVSASGNAAPTRRIFGSSTKIQSPTGIAVF